MIPRFRFRRRIAALAALAVALGGATGALMAGPSGADPFPSQPTVGAAEVSALDSAPTADGLALGARFAGTEFAREAGVVPSGVRLAASFDSGRVYAAPTDRGWLCVVLVHRALDDVPAASCAPRLRLADGLLAVQIFDGPRQITAGIVPDGYTSVETGGTVAAAVKNNAFQFATTADASEIVARGDGRPPLRTPTTR